MRTVILILILLAIGLPITAAAKSPLASASSVTICKKTVGDQEFKRTIIIQDTVFEGCRVALYRNDDARAEIVAHAKQDLSYCDGARDRIIANVRENGFACLTEANDD